MGTQEPADRRALLKEALAALDDMQAKLDASERARREPIAIVGMSCRFPGGADSPRSLWALLHDGVDAVGPVPADRWDADACYDADPNAPGKTYVREGGFLDRVDLFEPQFFGISPREANSLDPQQRLLLETTWEALEHAGQAPDRLTGTRTGVFVGITTADYGKLIDFSDPRNADVYAATGNALNAAAGRIAFTLGLQGPCASVDTACSSSLVAIHLACQSLRTGESSMAIAGGVNVMLVPEPLILFSKWGMIARDARCKTFDARADGFVRSEGCGVLVLKRLSDAAANNDHVLAVIAGSAVNQDGRSSGLTVPNGVAQQAVLRTALTSAGLTPGQIDYVEAHGTGTPLGDPIEVEALAAALGPGHTAEAPLRLGSIKTNIGHAEAASGVAGVMKVVLALQHEEIPPHLHLDALNPRIAWDRMPLSVPVTATAWPRGARPRYAGVSSFGFSGTNAHLVIGEAPVSAGAAPSAMERPLHVLALSSRTDSALRSLAARYREALAETTDSPADVCHSANTGRAHLVARAAVVASSIEELRTKLHAVAEGERAPGISMGRAALGEPPKIAFVFTGQGSQYFGMARGLYDAQPGFRAALDRCDAVLRGHMDRPLLSLLYAADAAAGELDATGNTQPALFAIEYALAELWRAWGIVPSAALGHSIGEYAAACAAGVLSLEDALPLVAARGRLMQRLPAGGAMAAVFAEESRVAAGVARFADRLSIAAVNGPTNVVISGDASAVAAVREEFSAAGIGSEPLRVSHAFHSPLMNPMLDEFESVARRIRHGVARCGLVSNVTGTWAAPGTLDATYWRRHVAAPVRFAASVQRLYDEGYRVFLEIGPTPTLTTMARRFVTGEDVRWIASLRQGKDDWAQMLDALGALYVAGAPVDWAGVDRDYTRRKVVLPTYPFERERCWLARGESGRPRGTALPSASNPGITVRRVRARALAGSVFEARIGTDDVPYLADHQLFGTVVFPAAGYVEAVLRAGREAFGPGVHAIEKLTIDAPLVLGSGESRLLQIAFSDSCDGVAAFEASSVAVDSDGREHWTQHATGLLRVEHTFETTKHVDLEDVRPSLQGVDVAQYYELLRTNGVEFGPAFKRLQTLARASNFALGRFEGDEASETSEGLVPAAPLVDTAFQVVGALLLSRRQSEDRVLVPIAFDYVRPGRIPREAWALASLRPDQDVDAGALVADVLLTTADGTIVGEVRGIRCHELPRAALNQLVGRSALDDGLFRIEWVEQPVVSPDAPPSREWLVIGDGSSAAHAIAERLEARGGQVRMLVTGSVLNLDGPIWQVDGRSADDFRRALLRWSENTALPGAVLFLPAPAEALIDSAIDDDALQALTCLLKPLSEMAVKPRLCVLTTGAQDSVGDLSISGVRQAPVIGLCRTALLEEPEIRCGLIDCPHEQLDSDVLVDAILAGQNGEVVIREGSVWERRLVRARIDPAGRATISPDGTYLITGGFGGLGLSSACWLARTGARSLVLVGRRPPDDAAREIIASLEESGATVRQAVVDVGDRAALQELFEEVARSPRPLRGVIHTAGALDDHVLGDLTPEAFASVMRGKVDGAWNLHLLTSGIPLDFFVLFSSVAAVFGSVGQGNYAAGNAYLDSLAHHRRANGLPALSINWSAWSNVGMAARLGQAHVSRWTQQGVRMISPDEGCAVLEQLLAGAPPSVVVMPADLEKLNELAPPHLRRLLANLVSTVPHAVARPAAIVPDKAKLLGASPESRDVQVRSYLRALVAGTLGLDDERVDSDQPLTAMGLDSLMAVELRNRLESDLRIVLPIVRFLDGSSVSHLSALLLEELTGRPDIAPSAVAGTGAVLAVAGEGFEEGEI